MKFATLISPLLNLGLMIQVIDLERHFQINIKLFHLLFINNENLETKVICL